MPNQPPPTAAVITPQLLKTHSITAEEYALIEQKLGRTPSLTELGIFSVMWSEHCSYKSSRVHLKRLPTKGTRTEGPGAVIQGPGENAGIIDVGDGWACAFKIESHNHPSYIEPYQGAATGVGGILRDIFTMGARPLAVMDSLRFGPLSPNAIPDSLDKGTSSAVPPAEPQHGASAPEVTPDYARNRQTMTGVVHGVAGYGNCFGAPNLGGETRFEDCYSGNPLLNAFALGLVRKDEIFYAKAEGVGNPVFYVGAKTGRDGIHGATMASEEFTEGSEQKRPNVQMGDPFLEKLLLEACLEVMKTGAVLGIQDMGAAGLTCSTCEMGARGALGVTIELDRVPQRETGMTTYEIMLSESQERMLLVAAKGREREVLEIFEKWGLDCAEVGTVTADDVMRVFHGGILEAEIPNKALTDEAPVYHRPVGTWNPPVPRDPPAHILELLKQPRDYTADLKALLASPNICSKHWIYEQYDSMVQTNTVQGPGGEAGVIRIKGTGTPAVHPALKGRGFSPAANAPSPDGALAPEGIPAPHSGLLDTLKNLIAESTPEGEAAVALSSSLQGPERGLAMALAGNGRWCYLDPKLGAMHAVAEAARKVACTGATPVAATNCLNFGNPQKPEIMAQLSQAIDGIAEACTALGTPITGGNVSLYNETLGEGIYPTPVIGVVGILDDVTKAVPSGFQAAGEFIVLLGSTGKRSFSQAHLGATTFAGLALHEYFGRPPELSLASESALQSFLTHLTENRWITSAQDISDGGIAACTAKACMAYGIGAFIDLAGLFADDEGPTEEGRDLAALFCEPSSAVIVTVNAQSMSHVMLAAKERNLPHTILGGTSELNGKFLSYRSSEGELMNTTNFIISCSQAELMDAYTNALESQLAEEVHA